MEQGKLDRLIKDKQEALDNVIAINRKYGGDDGLVNKEDWLNYKKEYEPALLILNNIIDNLNGKNVNMSLKSRLPHDVRGAGYGLTHDYLHRKKLNNL